MAAANNDYVVRLEPAIRCQLLACRFNFRCGNAIILAQDERSGRKDQRPLGSTVQLRRMLHSMGRMARMTLSLIAILAGTTQFVCIFADPHDPQSAKEPAAAWDMR